jgi:PBP1b-binding outer membrane lipoprotein LpoB
MTGYKIIIFICLLLIGCSGSSQNNSWYKNKQNDKENIQGVKYIDTIKTNGKFCKVYEVRVENEMPFKVISCGDIFYER